MPTYPNAIPRNTWDKHGERVSILDYLADKGNPTAAFNAAIQHASKVRGGCSIQIPVGEYVITQPIVVDVPNIVFHGEGENSVVQRDLHFQGGDAMFVIKASNITFRDFLVDGNITNPDHVVIQGGNFIIDGSSYPLDPMIDPFTYNSSFWVKSDAGPVDQVRFERITIQHTAGYAIIFDARHEYLTHMRVTDCRFLNNRPHLFGVTASDVAYGAWTGGILMEGDGSSNACHDVLVHGCSFMRIDGNCVWSHLYGFNRLHSNIRIKNNDFLDIGRDGVLMGGIDGGVVEGNTMRRIGYITIDDDNMSAPKWLRDQWAVGIDTSGLTVGVNYVNNVLTSCNGGYIDCDGYSSGTIVGNKCRTPAPTDPDYAADQIGAPGWGGRAADGQSDWAYGINFGNTSHAATGDRGARGATIVGNNFQNMGRNAIALYAARDSYVSDNDIYVQPAPSASPIVVGNILYPDPPADDTRGFNNVIINNRIYWSPTIYAPAVLEDANLSGYGQNYASGEGNQIRANDLIGTTYKTYEFMKDPSSTSSTAHHYASNFASATGDARLQQTSTHSIRREGRGDDGTSVLRVYNVDTGTAQLHMQLQAYARVDMTDPSHPVPVRMPLLNVSLGATAGTGNISTGNRTQAGFDDCVLTGKVYGDALWCLGSATYHDADADLLTADVGLIRYKTGTPNKFQMSVSVDGSGKRVWQDFGGGGGGGSVGGTDKSIVYNMNGNSWGDQNLQWDYDQQVMTVYGKSGQPGIQAINSYIRADQGFIVTQPAWNAFNGASSGAGAFLGAVSVAPYTPPATTPPAPPAPAPNGGYIDLAQLGYASYPRPLAGATFDNTQVLMWNAGQNDTPTDAINHTTGLMLNTFVNAAAGFATMATTWNAIQAPAGGVYGESLGASKYTHIGVHATDLVQGDLTTSDSLTPGTMFWNSTLNQLRVYDGNSWSTVGTGTTGGGVPGGIDKSIQYKVGSNFGGDANLLWDSTLRVQTILGVAGQQGLIVDKGYTMSNGYVSTLDSWSAINTIGTGYGGGAVTAGYAVAPHGSRGGYIDAAPLASQNFPVALPGLSAFGSNDVLMWVSGVNGTTSATAPQGAYGLMLNSFVNAYGGFATANTQYNSVQTAGGLNARSMAVTSYVQVGHGATTPTLTAGDTFQAGALYWSDTNKMLMAYDGTKWISLGLGGTGGAFGSIQYNKGGVLTGDNNLVWNDTAQSMAVAGKAGQAAISVTTGYVTSVGGFVSTADSYNAFQGAATGGGAWMAAYSTSAFNSKGAYYSVSALGYGSFPVAVTSASFAATDALLWVSTTNGTTTPVTTVALNTNIAVNSAVGFVTGNASYNSIQAPGGGVLARSLHADKYIDVGNSAGPPTKTTNANFRDGNLYWDTTQGNYQYYKAGAWQAFSGAAAGVDKSIQYNKAGAFAGDTYLYYDDAAHTFFVNATAANKPAIAVTGYMQSTGGFLTTAVGYNVIQASMAGGVYAAATTVAPDPGNTVGGYMAVKALTYSGNQPVALAGFTFDANTALLWAGGANGATAIALGLNTNAWIDAASGLRTSNASYNAIQASSGGVYARSLHSLYYVDIGQSSGAPTATTGAAFRAGNIYWDTSGTPGIRVHNGSAWVPLVPATSVPGGANRAVQYNSNGSFGGDTANFYWDTAAKVLYLVAADGASPALGATGYLQASGGFVTAGTSYNVIQAPSGGSLARLHKSTYYTQLGNNNGVSGGTGGPGLIGGDPSFTAGAIYWDVGYAQLRVYDGTTWGPIVAPSSGIGGALTTPRIPYALSSNTLTDTPNLFWEVSTNGLNTTALGVNSPTQASCVRISYGRVDNGGYITVPDAASFYTSAGCSYNGTSWVAKASSGTILAMVGTQIAWYQSDNNPVNGAYAVTERMIMTNAGIKFRFTAGNALQVLNTAENTWGGAVFGYLGINCPSPVSAVRISYGASNNGMFLTSTSPSQAFVSGGAYYNGSQWIATDTSSSAIQWNAGQIAFYAQTGLSVGGAFNIFQRGLIDTAGNFVWYSSVYCGLKLIIQSPAYVGGGVMLTNYQNNGNYMVLSMGYDGSNNLYLDNRSWNDIYIRPGDNRYVFMGSGAGNDFVCPNGDNNASLGHPSYRWKNIYCVTGLVASLNGVAGAVTLVAGANITITPSGQNITIAATGGGGGSYTGGTGVTVSNNVISIGQAVGATNSVNFANVITSSYIQINYNPGGTNWGLYLPYTYVYSKGVNSTDTSWNGIQSAGGISASSGFYVPSQVQVIDSGGVFVGKGVSCQSYGVGCSGVNVYSNGWYYGWTGYFTDANNILRHVVGGIIVTA